MYCAVAEELEWVPGRYFEGCQEKELVKAFMEDLETGEKLVANKHGNGGLEPYS